MRIRAAMVAAVLLAVSVGGAAAAHASAADAHGPAIVPASLGSPEHPINRHWGGTLTDGLPHTEDLCAKVHGLRSVTLDGHGVRTATVAARVSSVGGTRYLADPGHGEVVDDATLVCSGRFAGSGAPIPFLYSLRASLPCPDGAHPLYSSVGAGFSGGGPLTIQSGSFGTHHDGFWGYTVVVTSATDGSTPSLWGICLPR